MISKGFRHLKTVLRHKKEVFKVCCKFGITWQGIVHDMSKLGPTEFLRSIKYYQGNRSPIDAEKEDIGYSKIWMHHLHRNPHHWPYWMDFDLKQNMTPQRMPYKYAIESVADWIGANRAYLKDKSTNKTVFEYYKNNIRISNEVSSKIFHPTTRQLWDTIMVDLYEYGLDYIALYIKNGVYKNIYHDDTYIIHNMTIDYAKLLKKYFN